MKTPEQIARETLRKISGLPATPSGADLRGVMIAAIEADRAQRLTPSEGIAVARDGGFIVKAWQPDDIREQIARDEYGHLTEAEKSAIIEHAVTTYPWRHLDDCTDSDWEMVHLAITEAIEALEIEGARS